MSSTPTSYMVNAFDPTAANHLSKHTASLVERRNRVLGSALKLFYNNPVEVSHGRGSRLFSSDGTEYLDAYNNVPVVGHGNEAVQRAVAEQLGRANTHTRYLTSEILDYSERLLSLFPSPLTQVMYTCTGSEAVDLALRIARTLTGKRGTIITQNAYHGTTQAAVEISPSLGFENPAPAHVRRINAPDPLREGGPEAAQARFLTDLRDAIEQLTSEGEGVAAMIVDSILSSDGLRLEPAGFLAEAVSIVRESGALYIADEVQPGFARTGDWWGFERHRFVPDLAVLGKPMANGLPVAAVIGRSDLFDAFGSRMRYFNTFAGSQVGIAAASAVLDEIEQRELRSASTRLGTVLHEGMAAILSEHGLSERTEVRSAGLFLTVEYFSAADAVPQPEAALSMVNSLRQQRVLVSASGTYENALKIRPPLVFTDDDAARLLEAFDTSSRLLAAQL